ncbi:TetR/AcrR family transcriptional regulator [Marinicauda pacifica]|jgi:TetR/AcrR family transcriptional regulator, transcriptional repressor for nem operon|uniref:TetR/AcrR family transcriptional regulator n=1 Tax=Marinicauda pacifica TaxID=1133559 RepID=UPI0035C80A7D
MSKTSSASPVSSASGQATGSVSAGAVEPASQAPAGRRPNARERLLDAALKLIRETGYAATTVDALCAEAGATKGAFFHHFVSKDDLAVAAAAHWAETTGMLFETAPYHAPDDVLDRIFAYLDFRDALLAGTVPEFTCFAGTMIQEVHESAPAIRDAAYACVTGHASTLEADFAEALALYGAPDAPSAQSLALYTQAVLQGGFILAKGAGHAGPARETLAHLRRYLEQLFDRKETGHA